MEEKLLMTDPPKFSSGGVVPKPRPPASCGHDDDHYYFVDIGWGCPRCFAKAEAARKYKEEEATLNRLADKIAERMKTSEVIR